MDRSTVSTFTSMKNTHTMWRFLIKAPYLGKLCVIYDAENKGIERGSGRPFQAKGSFKDGFRRTFY